MRPRSLQNLLFLRYVEGTPARYLAATIKENHSMSDSPEADREDRDPIIIADAGPLIRLAAAGLLDAIRLSNRQIILVDRVERETCEDQSKPFAKEIADWIRKSANGIKHVRTAIGFAIEGLEAEAEKPGADQEILTLLKKTKKNSGERAIREYVENIDPSDFRDALVLYEDSDVPNFMYAASAVLTLMTTRSFARYLKDHGLNQDAEEALLSIRPQFTLQDAVISTKETKSTFKI